MLDMLSRYLPALSLMAVAILSVFNIGYFWDIGLHFLGLIDLSNLVYSFGLSLAFLGLLGPLAALLTRHSMSRGRLFFVAALAGPATLIGAFNPYGIIPDILLRHLMVLLGLSLSALGFVAWTWTRYREQGRWERVDLFWIMVGSFASIFQAGQFTAALEFRNPRIYDVAVKDGRSIQNARILRSSSTGFIFAVDQQVVFVPHSEIKSLESRFKVLK